MRRIAFVTLTLAVAAIAPRFTESAKILVVCPCMDPSQYICVQSYLKTLAARGHEITSVSAFPQKKPLKNFRDITLINRYTERAREISATFHDRPMKPLDAAIYWTEYVLRHKGAPQLREAARHWNFLQRHSVDTIAILFGIPLLLIIFITRGICKLLLAIFRSKDRENKKQKNE
ncbi:UDP-glucosyltransferase 2-like [Zeugodacus cucurbitae]|uniref:UDP-glucuronosyltransferase 1-1 n=1 Tax=Zeugodacus cucurbitae TaxID=28588 RepID=A0A0A1WPL1_ZEUCU|nr:UDP-glucosyltransferase 2-like [Zeugodacus cucurbitae]XP_054091869.1 UDP-glucosyltransferase 2-like [Zeugodacus cucurbitae]